MPRHFILPWKKKPRSTEPLSRILLTGERQIPYWLHLGDRRTMRLVIKPDLQVRVYAPWHVREPDLQRALQAKVPWMVKQLERMKDLHPLPPPRQYVSGEPFQYLGQVLRLQVEHGARPSVAVDGENLRVMANVPGDRAAVQRQLSAWCRQRAMQVIDERLAVLRPLADRYGMKPTRVRVRAMRSRWGSCSRLGSITLNVSLIELPVGCMDYVLIHELCHLVHHNHSPAFYALLTDCMPDWKTWRTLLKRQSPCGT